MPPKSRHEDIVVQDSGSETLLYDLKSNRAICLNESASIIWQNCDGKNTIPEIKGIVEKKFGKSVDADLVRFGIDQLKEENLLINGGEIVANFAGMSRREVIKRIGAGSAIAIPIVYGIVAPEAIHAQSCITLDGTVPAAPDAVIIDEGLCEDYCAANSPGLTLCCSGMVVVPNGVLINGGMACGCGSATVMGVSIDVCT